MNHKKVMYHSLCMEKPELCTTLVMSKNLKWIDVHKLKIYTKILSDMHMEMGRLRVGNVWISVRLKKE